MDNACNELSQSYLKKLKRKQLKSQHVVAKDLNVAIDCIPSQNIVICNCGLSNGLSLETLFKNYAKYGPINDLIMIPGKSYSMISFKSLEDSQRAFKETNGILKIAQDDKPVILGFTKTVPTLTNQPLFDQKPPGLKIIENAITESEEQFYISFANDCNCSNNTLKHRFVKHFGYEFQYGSNNIEKDKPLKEGLPEFTKKLWNSFDFSPDQLTINCYEPGQGIPSHVDTHSAFEEPIVSLSLGSNIVMDFKHEDNRHYSVVLPQRSLLIMSGESRYNWTHGITPRKLDIIPAVNGLTVHQRNLRISYTFRKIKRDPCSCNYPQKCDSQMKQNAGLLEEQAAKLESLHVQQVYDNIAEHFSDTRHKAWPNVVEFVQSFEMGSVLLDIGCGNGKNLGHNSDIFEIGCDNCIGLTNSCRKKQLEVFNCNCLSVPLKDEVADGIINIAVIHHLATETRRKQALSEIIRLLCKNGRALIYAWAKDQTKADKSSYLKQDRKNRKSSSDVSVNNPATKCIETLNVALPVHTNRKQFALQDMLVPWKLKGENSSDEFLRFYHVFEDDELKNMCESFQNVDILKYYYDQGNWCIIIQKNS